MTGQTVKVTTRQVVKSTDKTDRHKNDKTKTKPSKIRRDKPSQVTTRQTVTVMTRLTVKSNEAISLCAILNLTPIVPDHVHCHGDIDAWKSVLFQESDDCLLTCGKRYIAKKNLMILLFPYRFSEPFLRTSIFRRLGQETYSVAFPWHSLQTCIEENLEHEYQDCIERPLVKNTKPESKPTTSQMQSAADWTKEIWHENTEKYSLYSETLVLCWGHASF